MDATRHDLIMQRWNVVQHELIPGLKDEVGSLTPKLEKVIHVLESVRKLGDLDGARESGGRGREGQRP